MQHRNEQYESGISQVEADISEKLSQQEDLKLIQSLFEELGESCKRILLLFYFEDLSMKEICEQTEYSSEQVLRNKKYKCMKSLIERVKSSPNIYKQLQNALRNEAGL